MQDVLSQLTGPTLLISERRVRSNLTRMQARAVRHGLELIPHAKTHQHATVSRWLQEDGVAETTVTSLRMARECANHGWTRMTIGMPLNVHELPALNELAKALALTVFLTDAMTATTFNKRADPSVGFYVEVDAGYGRSGVPCADVRALRCIIDAGGRDRWRGFYVHSGHTYDARGKADVATVHRQLLARVAELRREFGADFRMAIGDTPACSTQEKFTGISSIGPGNYVYYDLTQAVIGSCAVEEIAVCAALPVLQVKSESGEVIVHGGWAQLGKDHLPEGSYGRVVKIDQRGYWTLLNAADRVTKLSQEHGTLRLTPSSLATLNLHAGSWIGVLPVHACATVHGMRLAGEQRIVS